MFFLGGSHLVDVLVHLELRFRRRAPLHGQRSHTNVRRSRISNGVNFEYFVRRCCGDWVLCILCWIGDYWSIFNFQCAKFISRQSAIKGFFDMSLTAGGPHLCVFIFAESKYLENLMKNVYVIGLASCTSSSSPSFFTGRCWTRSENFSTRQTCVFRVESLYSFLFCHGSNENARAQSCDRRDLFPTGNHASVGALAPNIWDFLIISRLPTTVLTNLAQCPPRLVSFCHMVQLTFCHPSY